MYINEIFMYISWEDPRVGTGCPAARRAPVFVDTNVLMRFRNRLRSAGSAGLATRGCRCCASCARLENSGSIPAFVLGCVDCGCGEVRFLPIPANGGLAGRPKSGWRPRDQPIYPQPGLPFLRVKLAKSSAGRSGCPWILLICRFGPDFANLNEGRSLPSEASRGTRTAECVRGAAPF